VLQTSSIRILYDYQAFSRQFYGGVSRYFVELARLLSRLENTEVKILAPLYINHYLKELGPGIVSGRQVAQAPKAAGKLFNIYNRVATRHQAASYQPDIVHETYYAQQSIPLHSNQARVITVYDMIHERFPEYFPGWDKTAVTKQLAVARADHVICISETTRRDLLEIGNVRPDKVSVVHLGFNSPQTPDAPTEPLINGPYLLHVGIRSGYKNFQRLLEAYGNSPTLHDHYRLVCFGGGKFSPAEERQRKTLGLAADRLVWMGGSDNVLMQLYRHAAAFVYPSLYEGFGIPPLEAMAHDCPVVCSTGGSISEVVGDAGEFFDPCDTDAIAQAIENAAGSQERTAELCALGRQRITCFTWKQCASGTHAVYSDLL
jgi:glycosyltransferase involved in cell wall biosynthesis